MKPVKGVMSGDEALELLELLDRLGEISLTDLAMEKRDGLTPVERMIEDLKSGKKTQARTLKGKTGVGRTRKPCVHWRIKARKAKVYYRDTLKPKRDQKKARDLATGAGWYAVQSACWSKKKVPSSVTLEEFESIVYPAFAGRMPFFKRYDTTIGVSLSNLYVVDCDTGHVLFDGSEWAMRSLGYIQ